MEATMLLCDSAEAVNGKLYILGAGWSVTGPVPAPSALAIKIDVPWNYANRRFPADLELLTSDGVPVTVPDQLGQPQPVRFHFDFEVGRPPGVAPGSTLDAVLAVSVPPLPLMAGSRFVWRLTINGETRQHWQVAFATRGAETRAGGPADIPPL